MAWTWRLEAADGTSVETRDPAPEFSSQADAESWLGEVWRALADQDVAQATLVEDGREVYGPMPLSEH
ncbi:MAG: hypothetical protein ACRDRL_15145 [Sciscionella sp.]